LKWPLLCSVKQLKETYENSSKENETQLQKLDA